MSKYELKMPSRDKIIDRVNEREIINKIMKGGFLLWFTENGYSDSDLKSMFNDRKRMTASDQNRFNITLRRCKKETGFMIFEMVIYLDDYFLKTKKILGITDEETKNIIKEELANKHNINIEKNSLREMFE